MAVRFSGSVAAVVALAAGAGGLIVIHTGRGPGCCKMALAAKCRGGQVCCRLSRSVLPVVTTFAALIHGAVVECAGMDNPGIGQVTMADVTFEDRVEMPLGFSTGQRAVMTTGTAGWRPGQAVVAMAVFTGSGGMAAGERKDGEEMIKIRIDISERLCRQAAWNDEQKKCIAGQPICRYLLPPHVLPPIWSSRCKTSRRVPASRTAKAVAGSVSTDC